MSETRNITRTPVEVYAELTPNPNSMKFVSNIMLLDDNTVEYNSKSEAKESPLAFQLFDFTGVKKIFITANFLTITKEDAIDWYDITNILREYIKSFLSGGEKVFIREMISQQATTPISGPTPAAVSSDPATEEKIRQLLDEYVRPAVEGDGGAIHLQSFHEGIVNVVLKGACSGCPSSTVTLKAGIETLLKKLVPEVKEVVAVNE